MFGNISDKILISLIFVSNFIIFLSTFTSPCAPEGWNQTVKLYFFGTQTIYYKQYLPLVKVGAIHFQFVPESLSQA